MVTIPEPTIDRLKAAVVWIDADVYRAARFDWESKQFKELASLASRGLLRVLWTDITKREVQSLMHEMWQDTHKATQGNAAVMRQLGHGAAVDALADEEACMNAMQEAFYKWLASCRAFKCPTEPNLPGVLNDYFEGKPPFGTGKKRAEFPDALVLSAIRGWCEMFGGQSLYIVSNDQGVLSACTPGGPLIATKSLNEVLSHGRASAVISNALEKVVQDSDYIREQMWSGVENLKVEVGSGSFRDSRYNLELRSVEMSDMEILETVIDSMEGNSINASAYVSATLELRLLVEEEPQLHDPDEWDRGSRSNQRVHVPAALTAAISAVVDEEGDIEIEEAYLVERRLDVGFDEIADRLE